jgi:hypothetical protein
MHPREVMLSTVGTHQTSELAQQWIARCSDVVPGKTDKPRQLPDFPGYNENLPFQSRIRLMQASQGIITQSDVANILTRSSYEDGFKAAVDLLAEKVALTCESLPATQIVLCAIPQAIVEYCAEAGSYLVRAGTQVKDRLFARLLRLEEETGQLHFLEGFTAASPGRKDFVYKNLRRALKARTMKETQRPIQIALETKLFSAASQHPAQKAWNFCVAMYYKSTGALPWRLEGMDPDTCFVGVSFFRALAEDSFNMHTSLAQVFSGDGEAFVVRGHRFHWDQKKSPHLTRDGAEELMQLVIRRYQEFRGGLVPRRVVLHKTSKFWKDEYEGFRAGLGHVREYDFVSLQQTGVRCFREGGYPPLRRTHIRLGTSDFLYTMGYIPELGTFPKGYVPEPYQLLDHRGDSTPRRLFREVLALTKMNFNNADLADGDPITVRFARRIGEILSYMGEGEENRHYRFYM